MDKGKNSNLGVTVSSTFTDLPDYHMALMELIRAHDLQAKEMEPQAQAPKDASVLDASLERVRNTAAYLCIITHKYAEGPISASGNPGGLSLAELEFNEAVRLNRPILMFVMAENHPIKTKGVVLLDAAKRAKLDSFRQRVKVWQHMRGDDSVYQEFSSLDNFQQQASAAIAQLRTRLLAPTGASPPAEQPAEASSPAQASKPVEASKPNQASKPVEANTHAGATPPAAAAKPGEPTKPSKPVEAGKPADAIKPLEAGKPAEPAKPAEASKAAPASKPAEAHKPVEAAKPAAPTHKPAAASPKPDVILEEPADRGTQALDFESYMRRKREGFTGRAWLFEEVREWLASEDGGAGLLVKADGGTGKSAFLSEYVGRFRGQQLPAWHFCRHDRPETLQPGRFVRSIAAQLGMVLPAYRRSLHNNPHLQKSLEDADAHPARAFQAAVLEPLGELPDPESTRLIVIDGLDESLHGTAGAALVKLVAGVAPLLPSWLRLLVSSRPVPEVLDALQGNFQSREIATDDPRNIEDLRQHALEAAGGKEIRELLEAEGKKPEFLAALLRNTSGGIFLFVRQALRELADGGLALKALDEMLPEGMDVFYRASFQRRFGSKAEKYGAVRALLGTMCSVCEPLTPSELAQVLGVTEPLVLALRKQVADFIDLISVGGRLVLSFEHTSLKEWLTLKKGEKGDVPRAAEFAVDLAQARLHLHRWALKRVDAGDAHKSPYLLRHLADHLKDHVEKQAAYVRLLLRGFDWPQARLEMSGVRGLLADLEHLQFHPEAPWLRELIRQAEPALRESVAQWPAQVLARMGLGASNLGLKSLAAAAERWASTHSGAHAALVPVRRSLRWGAELQKVQHKYKPPEPTGTVVPLPQGLIAYVRGHEVCVCEPGGDTPWVLKGHTGAVRTLAALPDGRVVSGSVDKTVRVWSLDGAAPLVLRGHSDGVRALAVLPDGRVVSASFDESVRVWNLDGTEPIVLDGHNHWVTSLAVLPDGRVVSGSADKTVRIWHVDAYEYQLLKGHTAGVNAVAVLPDGRVVSGSADKSVRVWHLDGSGAQVLEGHSGGVSTLAVLADGRVVSGSADTSVRVWRLDGSGAQVLEGHSKEITALAPLADGRLVSASTDTTVRVWTLDEARSEVLEGHTKDVIGLAVLPDGSVASASTDRSVRVWPLNALPPESPEEEEEEPEDDTATVTALGVLPDGRVISASSDKKVRLWRTDAPSGQLLDTHKDGVTALAVLPDGRLLSGSLDNSLRVWRLEGRNGHALAGHTASITALATLPDGRVASGSEDKTVRLWRLDGSGVQVLRGHTDGITSVAVLPDGRVASASWDKTVRVWNREGVATQVLEGHSGYVLAVVALPDGRVVSGSVDNTVRVWGADGTPRTLEGHTGWVNALAVLPDGRVVSGGEDNSVRVWSKDFEIQHSFIADGAISCLRVSSTGLIVAGCQDGTVHMLNLPPEASAAPLPQTSSITEGARERSAPAPAPQPGAAAGSQAGTARA